MLLKFAERITFFFISNNLLEEKLYDWYVYTIQRKLLNIIGIIICFFVGTSFLGFWETLLFIQSFFFIRQRSGGYHADKWWKCLLYSTVLILVNAFVIHSFRNNIDLLVELLVVVISIIIILSLSPINSPNLKLKKDALHANKKKVKRIVLWECIIMITSKIIFPHYNYAICCALGMASAALLILFSKTIKLEEK